MCYQLIRKNTLIIYLSNDRQINSIESLFDHVNIGTIIDGEINIIKKKS